MVGAVGNDDFGKSMTSALERDGVDVTGVKIVPEVSSGVALISVDKSGQNCIVVVPGANGEPIDVDPGLLRGVVVCQSEIHHETTAQALRLAHDKGLATIWNPAPAPPALASEILRSVSVLCPNESEAAALTGVTVTDVPSAVRAGVELLRRGVSTAIITMGKQGAVIVQSEEHDGWVHVAAPVVDAVDATGAGDCFVGALSVCWAREAPASLDALRRYVEFAVQVASISVQKSGTQTSYPTLEQVRAAGVVTPF
jgi:ribokinase